MAFLPPPPESMVDEGDLTLKPSGRSFVPPLPETRVDEQQTPEIFTGPDELEGQINTASKTWKQMRANAALQYAIGAATRLDPEYRYKEELYQAQLDGPAPFEMPADFKARTEKRARENYEKKLTLPRFQKRWEEEAADDRDTLLKSLQFAAKMNREANAIPQSEAVEKYEQSPGFLEKMKAVAHDPVELMANIGIKGGVQSIPMLMKAAAGGLVAGPPGAVGMTALGSFEAEYAGSIAEQLAASDVDLSDAEAVKAKLLDPKWLAEARHHAAARGIPVAAFDAMSAALAGRLVAPAVKEGAKQTLKQFAKETGEQAAMGAGGALAGQITSGEEINPTELFEEAAGEFAPGAAQVVAGAAVRRARSIRSGGGPGGPNANSEQSPMAPTGARRAGSVPQAGEGAAGTFRPPPPEARVEEAEAPTIEAEVEHRGQRYQKREGRWYPVSGLTRPEDAGLPLPEGDSRPSASSNDRHAARFISELEQLAGGEKPKAPAVTKPLAVGDSLPDYDPDELGAREVINRKVAAGKSRDEAVDERSQEVTRVGQAIDALPPGTVVSSKNGTQLYENVGTSDKADWQEVDAAGNFVKGSVSIGHNLRGGKIVKLGGVKAKVAPAFTEATAGQYAEMDPVEFSAMIAKTGKGATHAAYQLAHDLTPEGRSKIAEYEKAHRAAQAKFLEAMKGEADPAKQMAMVQQGMQWNDKAQYFNEAARMYDAVREVRSGVPIADVKKKYGMADDKSLEEAVAKSKKGGEKHGDEEKGQGGQGQEAKVLTEGSIPDDTRSETKLDEGVVRTQEIPIERAVYSAAAVPNFKQGATTKAGTVPGQELAGKYERVGTAPIVLWEPLNPEQYGMKPGELAIATGRHRAQLARTSGEKTIPSQVLREADGWTRERVMMLDAASNIRDGQGTIEDYADFFRSEFSKNLTEDEARAQGLLARNKGRAGWDIGKSASENLFAIYKSGKISDAQAAAIARTAPGNADLQRVGVRAALAGDSPAIIVEMLRSAVASQTAAGVDQGDFFANTTLDDQWNKEAKLVVAAKKEIEDEIKAIKNAANNPTAAAKHGVDVKDPEGVRKKITELQAELARWDKWRDYPDLVAKIRGQSEAPAPAKPAVAPDTSKKGLTEEKPKRARAVRSVKPEAPAKKPESAKPPEAEPKKPEAAKPNKSGLTDEEQKRLDDIHAKLRQKFNRSGSGPIIDPEIVTLGAELVSLHVKQGVRKFSDFAGRVKAELPEIWDAIKVHLRSMWEAAAVNNPEIEEVSRAQANETISTLDGTKPAKGETESGLKSGEVVEDTYEAGGRKARLVRGNVEGVNAGPGVFYWHVDYLEDGKWTTESIANNIKEPLTSTNRDTLWDDAKAQMDWLALSPEQQDEKRKAARGKAPAKEPESGTVEAKPETIDRPIDPVERWQGIVKLAADDPTKLRAVDVDRVMSDVPANEVEGFREWLLSKALPNETIAAVANWTPDTPIAPKDAEPIKIESSPKAEVVVGSDPTADFQMAISQANNHYTLWVARKPADGKGPWRWRYVAILGGNKAEAHERAIAAANRIASGDMTGIAFTGKDLFEGIKKISVLPDELGRDQLMGVDRISIGEQPLNFGRKHPNLKIKDLWATDPDYARWIIGEASGKRAGQIRDYITNQPEYITAQNNQVIAAAEAVSNEARELLNAHKLTAEPQPGGSILVGGETYDWKDTIKSFGGRFDGTTTSWRLTPKGFSDFIAKLGALPRPAGRQRAGIPLYLRDPRLGDLRKASDARPDRSGFTEPISQYVGSDTQELLKEGLKVGMPPMVVDEQIEDVARINRGYQRGDRLFLLASEPGSGKTFVLGGAIREARKSGAKKIGYVTLRQELITQIKQDLKAYGIGDVKFITYPEMRKLSPEKLDMLIFDEAHSIKNVNGEGDNVSQQAQAARNWIERAKMTVLASATPYENPTQAAYLEPTGIFAPFGGFWNFALAHGATERTVKIKTPRGLIEKKELVWKRTTTSDIDSKAAREFFRKEGVFTSRKIRLNPNSFDSRLVKVQANSGIADMYAAFTEAATEKEETIGTFAKMWVKNFQKRILESGKVERGIQEAEAAMKRGRWPIIFVETKAERKINIPDLIRREDEWARAVASTRKGDTPPARSEFGLPPQGITDIMASFMAKTGIEEIVIPSAEDIIEKHFGADNIAIFTGSVTPKKAQENLDRWRQPTRPIVLVATLAKGGTGLSLHDKVGNHQTTQININLPWTATGVVQVAQRSARYGLKGKAEMQWIFAENIPFDRELAGRVGGRMADMGSIVQGDKLQGADEIETWDFNGMPFSEVNEQTGKTPVPAEPVQPPAQKLSDYQTVAATYGWTIESGELKNRNGKTIAIINPKLGRLQFLSPSDKRVMGTIPVDDLAGFDKILKEKFYGEKLPAAPAPSPAKPAAPAPKFKEGDKVMIMVEGRPYREGTIAAHGPYRDGRHQYFVKTNLGESAIDEASLEPVTPEPAAPAEPGKTYARDPEQAAAVEFIRTDLTSGKPQGWEKAWAAYPTKSTDPKQLAKEEAWFKFAYNWWEDHWKPETDGQSIEQPDMTGLDQPSQDQQLNAVLEKGGTKADDALDQFWQEAGEMPPRIQGTVSAEKKAKDAGRVLTQEEAKNVQDQWFAQLKKIAGERSSENGNKIVLSLFDRTGVWAEPFHAAGYDVRVIDLATDGVDVKDIDMEWLAGYDLTDVWFVLSANPCDDFAGSGSRWWAEKDANGKTAYSVGLANHTLAIINYLKPVGWALENPVGRLSTLVPDVGEPRLQFHPFNYGDPYTKRTQIFGNFNPNLPQANVFPDEGSKMHKLRGDDPAQKAERSETPGGFAIAFALANVNLGPAGRVSEIVKENENAPAPKPSGLTPLDEVSELNVGDVLVENADGTGLTLTVAAVDPKGVDTIFTGGGNYQPSEKTLRQQSFESNRWFVAKSVTAAPAIGLTSPAAKRTFRQYEAAVKRGDSKGAARLKEIYDAYESYYRLHGEDADGDPRGIGAINADEEIVGLNPAQQERFQELSMKQRDARDKGGKPLTSDEAREYQELERLAGARDLLVESTGANNAAKLAEARRLYAKAEELDRQSNLAHDRGRASKNQEVREQHFLDAKRLDKAANEARVQASAIEMEVNPKAKIGFSLEQERVVEEAPESAKFRGILNLAADTPQKLRVVDVDRVMSEARSAGILEKFRKWLVDSGVTPDTADAVRNWKEQGDLFSAPAGWAETGEVEEQRDSRYDDLLADWQDAGTVLDAMLPNAVNDFERELITRLKEAGLKTRVRLMPDAEAARRGRATAAGTYNSKGDFIYIYAQSPNQHYTLLHELVHAATLRAMTDRSLAADLQEIMTKVKSTPGWMTHYGMTDIREMVAEAFSNPEFQAFLKRTKVDAANPQTLWDRFVAWVKKALGMQQATPAQTDALSRILELTSTRFAPISGSAPVTMNGEPMVLTAPKTGPVELPALRAFHGTPHKVDRFSTAKIGTGEGAQVYGWGLYFAGNEKVATEYQKQLGGIERYVEIAGRKIGLDHSQHRSQEEYNAANELIDARGNFKLARTRIETSYFKPAKVLSELDRLESEGAQYLTREGGQKYTVSLNVEPDELLDWDKPIGQQPEKIRQALEANRESREIRHADFHRPGVVPFEEWSAQSLYKYLSFPIYRQSEKSAARNASKFLASLGIKGIRYLDQGSRTSKTLPELERNAESARNYIRNIESAGLASAQNILAQERGRLAQIELEIEKAKNPTYNYVIFDDKDITITHENGQEVSPTVATEFSGDLALDPESLPSAENEGERLVDVEASGEFEKALNDAEKEGLFDKTQRMGVIDKILGRQHLTPEVRDAGRAYAKSIFDQAGIEVVEDEDGWWDVADSSTPQEEAGQKLLQLVRGELQKHADDKTGYMGNLINSIRLNMTTGKMFSKPLRMDLYTATQGEASHRGLLLGALAGLQKSISYVGRNVEALLHKEYHGRYGGDFIDKIMPRIIREFRGFFTDEEIQQAVAQNPKLQEFFDKVFAINRADVGGRLFRRVQSYLKPKPVKLKKMMENAKLEEAFQEIIAQAKKLGIEPPPVDAKKKLTTREALALMAKPETTGQLNDAIDIAVQDAELAAARKVALKKAKTAEDKAAIMDESWEPTEDQVEAGFDLPEYSHWREIRDNLLGYSPVTVSLARKLIQSEFKGTDYAKTAAKPGALKIDLAKLAVAPEEEVRRVLEEYYRGVEATVLRAGASPESKARILSLVRDEVADQLTKAKQKRLEPIFRDPAKPGTQPTPMQQVEQLGNAGIFMDPRLDSREQVEKVAGRSPFSRLVPNLPELIKAAIDTPFYRQGDLGRAFADKLVKELGLTPEQAKGASTLFNEAFAQKFKVARERALANVEKSLTPKERRKQPEQKATWRKISEAVNAGFFDSGEALRRIAAANGWAVPTDEQIEKMRGWVEKMERMKELTQAERDAVGDNPLDLERALRDKASATLEKRVAIKKQIEAMWARLTHPLAIPLSKQWFKNASSRTNTARAINEFASANLLFKLSFPFRQIIDVMTQGGIHTPTRAIAAAIERYGLDPVVNAETGEVGNKQSLWKEVGSALKDAYQARSKAYRAALQAARDAFAGTGEARNVDRLMSSIAVFDRAAQIADEHEAAGRTGQAAALRLFTLLKMGFRIAQAMDNIHGLPAEYQEMRQQVVTTLRENGQTPAEAFTNADKIIGDMKAEYELAVARAQSILDGLHAAGLAKKPTANEVKGAAWMLVKGRAYQRMQEAGLPADEFEESNRLLRSTVGWNEREDGGIIGGTIGKVMAAATQATQKAGIPMPLLRFGNAIATSINRSLSFTPLGFFPSAFEGSPWYKTEQDKTQRKVEAAIGTTLGLSLFALAVSGALKVRNRWPKDKEERELWEREGHRPGTVEIDLGGGNFLPISMTTGPLTLVRPWLAAGGAIRDLLDERAKAQAKLNAEAEQLGLPAKQLPGPSASDLLGVAASTAWGSIVGGRTASGLIGSVTDYGTPNIKKSAAAVISPVLPTLPAAQELSRMAGVRVDPKLAGVTDFLLPMSGSRAQQLNLLGDPVGTDNDIQRIVQILTGGTGLPVNPQDVKDQAAYAALYSSGYRPPSINPGKGYEFNGEFRPMTQDELVDYTKARGQFLKQELADLGDEPTKKAVRAAYTRANNAALSQVGATVETTTVKTPTATARTTTVTYPSIPRARIPAGRALRRPTVRRTALRRRSVRATRTRRARFRSSLMPRRRTRATRSTRARSTRSMRA